RGELDIDPGLADFTGRLNGADAIHTTDTTLNDLDDLAIDDFRCRARVVDHHRNNGRVDIGIFPYRKLGQCGQAKHHDQQIDDRGEYRTLDRGVRQDHQWFPQ